MRKKKPDESESDKAKLVAVRKEMAKPRVAASARGRKMKRITWNRRTKRALESISPSP